MLDKQKKVKGSFSTKTFYGGTNRLDFPFPEQLSRYGTKSALRDLGPHPRRVFPKPDLTVGEGRRPSVDCRLDCPDLDPDFKKTVRSVPFPTPLPTTKVDTETVEIVTLRSEGVGDGISLLTSRYTLRGRLTVSSRIGSVSV